MKPDGSFPFCAQRKHAAISVLRKAASVSWASGKKRANDRAVEMIDAALEEPGVDSNTSLEGDFLLYDRHSISWFQCDRIFHLKLIL